MEIKQMGVEINIYRNLEEFKWNHFINLN